MTQSLTIEALADLPSNNSKLQKGGKAVFPSREGLELILSGQAKLAEKQVTPPFAVLDAIEHALNDIERFGPEYSDPAVLERFDKAVLEGGRRKSILDGRVLTWLDGIQSLTKASTKMHELESANLTDLKTQMNSCISYVKKFADVKYFPQKLSEEYRIEKGFLPAPSKTNKYLQSGNNDGFKYICVGSEWAKFSAKLEGVFKSITSIHEKCLRAGRILAVEETLSGSVLIPPSHWLANNLRKTKDQHYVFLFSRDLPSNRFGQKNGALNKEMRGQKAAAVVWLNEEYQKLSIKGVRPSKTDVLKYIQSRFGLSKNQTSEVWKKAEVIKWEGKGRIPEGKRYYYNNIK